VGLFLYEEGDSGEYCGYVCLESSEELTAAIGPRINCEHHTLAAVAHRDGLKTVSSTFNMMADLRPNYVGRIKFEAVADIDFMGDRAYC
jgi:hypothetical protein